jgi:signal transduction histidine kinase
MPGSAISKSANPGVWSLSRIRFISFAIVLLMIAGIGTGAYFTGTAVARTQNWIVHTYQVRTTLQELRTQLAETRASAAMCLLSRDPDQLARFRSRVSDIPSLIRKLRELTSDSLGQTDRLNRLEPLLQQQFAQMQSKAASGFVADEPRIDSLLQNILNDENQLLQNRLASWNTLFRRNLLMVIPAFLAALFLLGYNFHLLRAEVYATREKERLQHENAESYRVLSARLLEMQDSERRRIARELHDSVGQYLAGLKINLHQLESSKISAAPDDSRILSEALDLADQAITEVRTMSHLLHPPLLDELGLESAARWYVEGFAKRSGLKAELTVGDIRGRLAKETELALFRVLQETLTNVHRHAEARSVAIELSLAGEQAVLAVRDDGKGIPSDVLHKFRSGLAAGIGLAGMRERVAELGGQLRVDSTSGGAIVCATLPTVPVQPQDGKSLSVLLNMPDSNTRDDRVVHP